MQQRINAHPEAPEATATIQLLRISTKLIDDMHRLIGLEYGNLMETANISRLDFRDRSGRGRRIGMNDDDDPGRLRHDPGGSRLRIAPLADGGDHRQPVGKARRHRVGQKPLPLLLADRTTLGKRKPEIERGLDRVRTGKSRLNEDEAETQDDKNAAQRQATPSFFCRLVDEVVYWKVSF